MIIVRDVPRLQGKTVPGLSQHLRNLSNVAGAHHFLCLLVSNLHRHLLRGCRDRLLNQP